MTTAMSAEESLYRCSAGFSDFLTANVLAACKSRSGPRPIGLRPSPFVRVGCGAGVFNVVRRNVPSAILFCFVAVLKREYHNLHRRVTARAQEWWSAPTDLGGVAGSIGCR